MAHKDAAGVFLYRVRMGGKAEFLLLRARRHGEWGFPKGHRDEGDEDLLATAMRELKEETGIERVLLHGVTRYELKYTVAAGARDAVGYDKRVLYFLARCDGGEVRLSPEHTEYRWADANEVRRLIAHPNLLTVFDTARATLVSDIGGAHLMNTEADHCQEPSPRAFEVVLTGTGFPRPHPERAGPGTLVIGGGRNYQFDCGRGTTMRLAALGLLPVQLDGLIFTHYHSDHMTDLADVLMSRWILDAAPKPLPLYGPPGLGEICDAMSSLLNADVDRRKSHSGKPVGLNIDWREFKRPASGELAMVLSEHGVTIQAAAVDHGNVTHAVGYRVEFGGRAIAISGDTTFCDELVLLARDADVLVHEILSPKRLLERMGGKSSYIVEYHSSPEQVARVAREARVRKLVLTHLIPAPNGEAEEAALREEVARAGFQGEIVVGRDLTRVAAS